MGFWDSAGKVAMSVGRFAIDEIKKTSDRSKVYSEEMVGKNDSQLLGIIKKEKSSSPMRAAAAYKELKNRGHDPEEIKRKLN